MDNRVSMRHLRNAYHGLHHTFGVPRVSTISQFCSTHPRSTAYLRCQPAQHARDLPAAAQMLWFFQVPSDSFGRLRLCPFGSLGQLLPGQGVLGRRAITVEMHPEP